MFVCNNIILTFQKLVLEKIFQVVAQTNQNM